jgi:proline dehydrogenase
VKALTFLARRFVAGEGPEDAVRAGRALAARGITATFDELGEDVLDEATARRAAESARSLLRLIPEGVDRNVSIKLSSTGQAISRDFCLEQAASILEAARSVGGFVRLDMEGSKLTQDTIDVFHELRKHFDNVGIVLQAYLHRTAEDVAEAVRRGDRVRLCKGAYKEPETIAWTDMEDIRRSYKECARVLLDRGNYPTTRSSSRTPSATPTSRRSQRRASSSRCSTACARSAGTSSWPPARTCASTSPTAPTGCPTSTAGCANGRKTCSSS